MNPNATPESTIEPVEFAEEATTPLFDSALEIPGSPSIDLVNGPAEEILRYAVEQFHPRLYVASSFQKEASVILDMLLKIEPNARFFTIDTGNLFPETFDVWRKIEERYDVKIDVYNATDFAPASILAQSTPENTWAGEPDACCGKYKVAALQAALLNVDAWITGLRREQAHTRAETRKVQWDAKNDRWKICPLADWTEKDVWNYLSANDVPYNELHDRGYSSIGCTTCTQPGDGREGRWADSEKTECGLHG
ncbi:MAG: phosphoadenylyl-sulfate reductase [Actinobacteria bacterium]|nr:phosphoadenylyl-sulfate reductase [Actinomycetota bacterium]